MKQATYICYNLILKIDNLQDFKKQAILLGSLTTHGITHLSAAGFYNVDFTSMFIVLSSVSSLLILVRQLDQNGDEMPSNLKIYVAQNVSKPKIN